MRKTLLGAGTALTLGTLAILPAARWAAGRRAALREVSPELRSSPILFALPLVPASDAVVALMRRAASFATPALPPGATRDTAPGRGGRPDVPVIVYAPPSQIPPPAADADAPPKLADATIPQSPTDAVPRFTPTGALLWIHGGGRVIGAADIDHAICTYLARETGATVVSVDHRLAPEHPFPAALDDVITALEWLHTRACDLGVDQARIAIGGASAGGGLAAEAAQRGHDEGLPLAFQLLLYPMLDDRTLPGSVAAGRDRPWWTWTPAQNRYGWSAYLGHPAGTQENRPYAVAARRADLSGLPPAWIGVGSLDLFLDECRAYAARLRAAGVPVDLHVEPGMPHGVDQGAPTAPSMRALHGRMASALREALGTPADPAA